MAEKQALTTGPEEARIVPKELSPDTQDVLSTIATIEMYRAQREVANYLELAYLRLADHPEQAKEVRLTAHAARTEHVMTTGLMKKFKLTAGHIVNTSIPMIIDAVRELQSPEIVDDIFSHIVKLAEEMKKETEDTQRRYIEIQTEVQKNMASVTECNKKVVDDQARIKIEMEREKQIARDAKLAQEELEEESRQMDKDLKVLASDKEKFMEKAEKVGKSIVEAEEAAFDSILIPGSALEGGLGKAALKVAAAGMNFLTGLFRSDRREKHFDKLMDAYKDTQTAMGKTRDKKLDVLRRMHEQRKEALERLATLKKLGMETANLGNVESLREAHAQLGNVDKQFSRIIQFWSNMAAVLKAMRDETTAGHAYLAHIANPKVADRFVTTVENAEKGWIFFGRLCGDYVEESDIAIYQLYDFLSAPIDSMAAEERQKRQENVLRAIEADIENTYPQ